jgi:hypothetical protein
MAHIGHRVMISVAETANFLQQAADFWRDDDRADFVN